MIDTGILAEITSKWDISGIFCIASVFFIMIAALAYSTGPWSGSCTCLFFFIIGISMNHIARPRETQKTTTWAIIAQKNLGDVNLNTESEQIINKSNKVVV